MDEKELTAQKEALSQRLRQAMDAYKVDGAPISEYRLGKESGVGQSTINRTLNKETLPSARTIRTLAEFLQVPYAWLLDDVGDISDARSSNDSPGRMEQFTEPPRIAPIMMTGPHFLTPDEWLLISYSRRADETGRRDLLALAESLKLILNPPKAGGQD